MVIVPDDQLIDLKEALIFAFLGLMKSKNRINVFSSVTGSSKDHSAGQYYLP
jgi:anhydro-N-acetylmuramic acid kinase